MKFVILNQHSDNVGDDAAGLALIQQIKDKFPKSNIELVYNTTGKLPIEDIDIKHHKRNQFGKKDILNICQYFLSKYFTFIKFKNKNIKDLIKILEGADYVLISPCGANIGIYKDWSFLIRIFISIVEGHEPVFHLNTIGSSGNWIFDKISNWVLRRSKVYVRESKSFKYLINKNINVVRGTDTAFSLSIKDDDVDSELKQFSKEDYVVFIPTQLDNWHPTFRNKGVDKRIKENFIPQIAEFIVESKKKLIILPHMIGECKEDKFLEDIRMSLIDNGVERDRVYIIKESRDVFGYDYIIKNAYIAISMRYHGDIFAIKNSIPFVSLAYENKMIEACGYSQMLEYNIDLTNKNDKNLYGMLTNIENNHSKIQQKLKRQNLILKNLSELPVQDIYINNIY